VTQTQEKSLHSAGTGNHKDISLKTHVDLDIASPGNQFHFGKPGVVRGDFVRNNGIEEQRNKEKGQLESLSEGNSPSEESTACEPQVIDLTFGDLYLRQAPDLPGAKRSL